MSFLKFIMYLAMAMLILLLCITLGDKAPWYFAWLLGTVMIILIAVAGAVLLEGQEAEQRGEGTN